MMRPAIGARREGGGGGMCSLPPGDWTASSSRYQRVIPDVLPLGNGRKPCLRPCKEHDAVLDYTSEAKPSLLARSASGSANPSPPRDQPCSFPSDSSPARSSDRPPSSSTATAAKAQNHHYHREVNGLSPDGGGDVLLQWGHNKRSRGSRAEASPAAHSRHKIQLRSAATVMPPPSCGSFSRGANYRPLITRGTEDSSSGLTRTERRCPASPPEKSRKASAKATLNGCTAADVSANPEQSKRAPDRETGGGGGTMTAGEKLNLDKFEWPRIYVSLSRKEKEDDFLAMKGTKLPHRPKKRAKNIEKALQYCFPGMWLSDLTRGRYEVREKKSVKKKRAGLKAMESLDSDSE
ncbi:uncharacterized protein LOC135585008 isoform X3 [Musa acuminata AAA Group]|uniref:uncharacterized protein LOC135585008 isoform X3 n=1 Tax=Musa acuminata AAA Group TaxID=214697 RepID=UPI0008A0D664|nr:PREDICTED: uncharacterized protein LOC103988810 isoform X1 [Musa acuminata subsp. malaccensis]